MKNKDLTGLLNLAYEIEGLLMLHISRGEEASQDMEQLLIAKAEKLLAGLTADSCADNEVQAISLKEEVVSTPTEAVASCTEVPAVEVDNSAVEVEESVETSTPVIERKMTDGYEPEKSDEAAVETADADAEAVAESAVAEETADADVAVTTVNDTLGAETQLTLDEKLARERASDISKAFTLNDRFRFRRELFRNSDEEFRETLEAIGSMADMDEAEDYFFNDLCWDASDSVVNEFMAIVAKHF